jgi:hypothetical protein
MNIVGIETFSPAQVNEAVESLVISMGDPIARSRAEGFLGQVNDIDGQMAGQSSTVMTGVSPEGHLVGAQYRLGRTFTIMLGGLAGTGQMLCTELDPSVGIHPWDPRDLDDLRELEKKSDLHIAAAEVPAQGPTAELASVLAGRDIDIYRRTAATAGDRYGRLRVPVGRIGSLPLLSIPGIFRIYEAARQR